MSDRPTPKPGVLKIASYIPGRSTADVGVKPIKLSSNESPLGTSPKAMAALSELGNNLASYPDGRSVGLRKALAKVHKLDVERIIIGSGSDEILHLLAQVYLNEGDEAVISQYGFLMYPIVTLGAGAVPVYALDKDYCVDVDAMLDAVSARTKIVFLANPNNPTGTYLAADELARLHRGLRSDILLVIDSAYAEYVTAKDYLAGAKLVEENENIVMVRTFSKIGLAALRVGWMFGPENIIDALNRLRGPFNINVAAQLAGEAAALDSEFISELRTHNSKWREWLSYEINSNAIRVLPSQGNFILAVFNGDGEDAARLANAALLKQGLVVREMGAYGLKNALRISIGRENAMRKTADVLKGLNI